MTRVTQRQLPVEPRRGPFAPYAPVRSVEAVLSADRDRALAEPINRASLAEIGVTPTMCPRTLQALRYLVLIDERGYRTDEFEILRAASPADFPAQLAVILRAAYRDVFARLASKPLTDRHLAEAFRTYEPANQRRRMAGLFRGLLRRAELIAAQSDRAVASQPHPPSQRRRVQGTDVAFATLLERLPRAGKWTRQERERWLRALTATVDLFIAVAPDEVE